MNWAQVMQSYDNNIALLFVGVCSYALNWYLFPSGPARRVLEVIPLVAVPVLLVCEVILR